MNNDLQKAIEFLKNNPQFADMLRNNPAVSSWMNSPEGKTLQNNFRNMSPEEALQNAQNINSPEMLNMFASLQNSMQNKK